jgi:hypothetical protein
MPDIFGDSRDFEWRRMWLDVTRKNWFKAGTLIGEKFKSDDSLLQSSSFQVEVDVNC